MTCRLPQTPRTPTTAAAHYFDDVFLRQARPKKPPGLRRSSTTRSIGMRSDWTGSAHDDEEDNEEAVASPLKRVNSIGYLDADALKRKAEVDEQVAHYIADQLERVKTGRSNSTYDDELETHLDGSNEKNGHAHG